MLELTTYALDAGSSYSGGQWAAGSEPLYYIVSPKDVVIAKPRSASDLNWILPSVLFFHASIRLSFEGNPFCFFLTLFLNMICAEFQ